jgi:hypothetical protein
METYELGCDYSPALSYSKHGWLGILYRWASNNRGSNLAYYGQAGAYIGTGPDPTHGAVLRSITA